MIAKKRERGEELRNERRGENRVRDALLIASIGCRTASCIVRSPRDELRNDGR